MNSDTVASDSSTTIVTQEAPQHATFAVALAAAQTEMTNPVRDKENPHFHSRYTSLAAVRDAVIPAYARHGIGTILEPRTLEDGRLGIFCHLFWGVEQHTFGPVAFGVDQKNPQVAGSAATYGERYMLSAVGGVAAGDDDDDDGNIVADAAKVQIASESARPNGVYGRTSGRERPAPNLNPNLFAALRRAIADQGLTAHASADESGVPITWGDLENWMHDAARSDEAHPSGRAITGDLLVLAQELLAPYRTVPESVPKTAAIRPDAAPHPQSGAVMPFGDSKGQPIESATYRDLAGALAYKRKHPRPKYAAEDAQWMASVMMELARRDAGKSPEES